MDRLQTMAVFVAVADSGGFASAARRLGLSAPAVTRAVADLEERLGLKLLHRTTRSVRLTEAGSGYVDECRRLLAEIDQADADAAGRNATARGSLLVTAPVLFGRMVVLPIVLRYLREQPQVQASCVFVDRVVSLDDEGLDVGVRIGVLPDSSLQAVPVGRVRSVLVASPGYLAARGRPGRPADLAGHDLIAPSGLYPGTQWRFAVDGAPQVQAIAPRLRTSTNDAALAAAEAGFGIARLLSYQAAPALQAGTLVALMTDCEPPPSPIHLVHREGRRARRKVRDFIDLAADVLRADASLR